MLVIKGATFKATGSMNMILSMAIGALIGEIINVDGMFEKFGQWLKYKTGSHEDHQFIQGFVTASLTVSIGAMAIMGAIQDGMTGDHSLLFAKAILDFVIILVMTSSMGKGCLFSFIPVVLLQGTVTILSAGLASFMTPYLF